MRLITTNNGLPSSSTGRREGFVIVAVLIVIAVLSLAAYQYSNLMSTELMASERIRKTAESKAFADSGIHYLAAMLADPEAFQSKLNSNPFDNSSVFDFVLIQESESPAGQGRFSLIAPDYTQLNQGTATLRYGAIDEGGKININALYALDTSGKILHDALMKLPDMTDDIAWAIVDWIDPDDTTQGGGPESAAYSSLIPSYLPKNGPLDTIEELLLVQGVTPTLLYGTDLNRNGKIDANEDQSGTLSPGWATFLTVYSRERNVGNEGLARINLNGNDLATLKTDLDGAVGSEMANFILAIRLYGSSSTSSNSGSSGTTGGSGDTSGSSGSGNSGGSGNTGAGSNTGSGGSSSGNVVDGNVADLETLIQQAITNGTQPRQRISSIFSLVNATVTPSASNMGDSSGGGNAGGSNTNTGGTSGTSGNTGAKGGNSGGGKGGNSKGGSGGSSGGSGSGNQATMTVRYQSPLANPANQGDLLGKVLDLCTTQASSELPARVNVCTAPREVLLAVPGMEESDVELILAKRPNYASGNAPDTRFSTPAWLLTDATLQASKLQSLERYITSRTQVYRVISVGYFDEAGPISRVEAVIDANQGKPRIVYYRDLTDLGRAIDPRLTNR